MLTNQIRRLRTGYDRCFAPADLTSWDGLFKDDYHSGAIINTLQDENLVQGLMTEEVSDESWVGRKKIVPVRIGRNYSTGSIPVKGALPLAGRGAYKDFEIPMRNVYFRVGFDKWVMLQSRNKKGSWAQVVSQEMTTAVEDAAYRRNVMAWGYGSGILALVNGAHVTQTKLEVKAPLNVAGAVGANRYLHGDTISGMFIAILDGGTQAIKATATIIGVNADGTDVTLDAAVNAADGDFVVSAQSATQTSYNQEPEGILAGIDDGTYVNIYHALNRTTYPIIKAYVVTNVGPLSLDALQQPFDAVAISVGGKMVDALIMEHSARRAYLALLEADRRYQGADLMKPDGGTKAVKKPSGRGAITYGDVPVFTERDAPYGMIFGFKKESWVRYYEDNGGWAAEEGDTIKWVQGYDEYTAFYRLFENYHCHEPRRNFRMEGVQVNQMVVPSF